MNAEQAVRELLSDKESVAIRVKNKQEYLDVIAILYDEGIKWDNDSDYNTMYDNLYRHYGDESCISAGDDNSLSYADKEYYLNEGYKVIQLTTSSLIPLIMDSLKVHSGDKIDILYTERAEYDSYNPYTYTRGKLIDCDGDECDTDVLGLLVAGEMYCKPYEFPKVGKLFYYIDFNGTIRNEEYAKDSVLCRALKAMGNLFPTLKEAEDNVDTIVKLYSK